MDIKDIRSIGKKPRKSKAQKPEFMPTPEQIAAECAMIRAENEAASRQGKKPQPVVYDDCDAELEVEADRECLE